MNIFVAATQDPTKLHYNPLAAFTSEEAAKDWAKKQNKKYKYCIFPFDVPDTWKEKIFSGHNLPAIYIALWVLPDKTLTFFPDSIACSREEVNQYIELLSESIRGSCFPYGLVVRGILRGI